ncbi:MAG: hypothetical protein ACXVLQ_08590 [Bacteriovorax sp.]
MSTGKARKILRAILLYPLALVLLFEEWGWEPLAALFERLGRIPPIRAIERRLAHLSPWWSMTLLMSSVTFLLPLKLFGFFLFNRGHFILGILTIISAKIFATALFARLFYLTRPSLMKLSWFAYWYPRWKNWKDQLMIKVRSSAPWAWAHHKKLQLKNWWNVKRLMDLRHKRKLK